MWHHLTSCDITWRHVCVMWWHVCITWRHVTSCDVMCACDICPFQPTMVWNAPSKWIGLSISTSNGLKCTVQMNWTLHLNLQWFEMNRPNELDCAFQPTMVWNEPSKWIGLFISTYNGLKWTVQMNWVRPFKPTIGVAPWCWTFLVAIGHVLCWKERSKWTMQLHPDWRWMDHLR